MLLPRIHETTVLYPEREELSWHFLVVPQHSISDSELSIDLSLIEKLELQKIRDIEPSWLSFLVASMLEPEGESKGQEQVLVTAEWYARWWPWRHDYLNRRDVEAIEFAEQVVFRKLVPFESSPLAAESLASIAATALDARENTGAALVELEGKPLLIVASTDGLVVSGARSRELNEHIWEKLLRWLRGTEPAGAS